MRTKNVLMRARDPIASDRKIFILLEVLMALAV